MQRIALISGIIEKKLVSISGKIEKNDIRISGKIELFYRPKLQSDIPSVILDVTLNGTEMAVLAVLKQKPDSSRGEIADKISKTVRTVQRALDSLRDKGYIRRVGSKQEPKWDVLKYKI
ncbi:MAG: MarR family transcriptional regulator [Flexilinea sp.]|nr:MarR family transcriptional regulator [Flexilinea sp.]